MCGIFGVSVNQEWVCFVVDVLDDDLEAVEASGYGQLDFCGEIAAETFIDNAVRCRKKS